MIIIKNSVYITKILENSYIALNSSSFVRDEHNVEYGAKYDADLLDDSGFIFKEFIGNKTKFVWPYNQKH